MKVTGSNPFSVPTNSFAISPSQQGYTLQYSVDGESWDDYSEATASGVTAIVNFAPKGMLYRLSGNTSEVYLQY